MRRSRRYARFSALVIGALIVPLAGLAPASAHSDLDRVANQQQRGATRLLAPTQISANVRLLSSQPGQVGIAGCFLTTAPVFVQSNVDSVRVFDVSDPAAPVLTGMLADVHFENEAMNCGERRTAAGIRRFVMIGVDPVEVSPGDLGHVNLGSGQELVVVDVTDPADPFISARVPATTSTHTVACVDGTDCTFAYSAGDDAFSIFDLRRLDRPREVDFDPRSPGVQPFPTPTGGHKWNFTGTYGVHTGWNGSSIWDVSKPRNPRLLATTGRAGRGDDPNYPGYNDFIHHNSAWPNAGRFVANAEPSFTNGNVLLVTEEDYEQTDCSAAGSFQTWWIKRLNGKPRAVVPLDKVELADLGTYPLPQGGFCSSHWFDVHPSGIVAVAFYGGGTQFLDVRNPRRIASYGHAVWGVSEVWDAYFVPVYSSKGRQTGAKSDIVYSVDALRGLDVYQVDLPGGARSSASPLPGAGAGGSALGAGLFLLLILALAAIPRWAVRARPAAA